VREGQIARIKAVKAARDEAACQAALAALTEGAKGGGNLLALAVDAARARATLGEISSTRWKRSSAAMAPADPGEGRLCRPL
jgi:methylmalonyl-CoA mutase